MTCEVPGYGKIHFYLTPVGKKNTSPHTEEGWELHLLLVEYSLVAGDLNLLNVRQTDSLDRLLRLVI